MNRDQITATVQDIFRDVLDNPSLIIAEELTAADVDDWDSLAHISIITGIEQAFRIRLSLSEIDGFNCIGDMIDSVEKKLA
jgi:acyl carrier protein